MIFKAKELIREFGKLNGILYILHRVISKIQFCRFALIKYYIYFQPRQNEFLASNRAKKTEIIRVEKKSPLISDFPRPPYVIERRFNAENICFSAYKNQEFVGYLWLAQDIYEEDEVRCDYHLLPKGALCWDYDVYIAPKFRIGFAFSKLWDAANMFMKENGKIGTMSRVSAFNLISIRSHEKLGAKKLGSQTFLVIGSLQIMCSTKKPYVHVSFKKTTRAVVELHAPDS